VIAGRRRSRDPARVTTSLAGCARAGADGPR
jgi:hypothetical protein